jgi:hypothetical protein
MLGSERVPAPLVLTPTIPSFIYFPVSRSIFSQCLADVAPPFCLLFPASCHRLSTRGAVLSRMGTYGDGKAPDGTTNLLTGHSSTRPDEDFFATSQEEELLLATEVSPPYRPAPSSSNPRLPIHPSPDHNLSYYASSPPYKSSSGVNLLEEPSMMYRRLTPGKEKTSVEDEKPKPSVHYPHNMKPPSQKQDSYDPYATSSIAGTDDEDSEEFDWSGEEDLVDEEARFEKKMGIKSKPQGWSFVRYTTTICLFALLIHNVGQDYRHPFLYYTGLYVHGRPPCHSTAHGSLLLV